MLALGKYIADKIGLGGEEFSKIWNDLYKRLTEKQFNKETYKKLIESSEGLFKNDKSTDDFEVIKNAFSVDDTFLR